MKGFNFTITSKTLPNKDISRMENAVRILKKKEADKICAKISLTLQNFRLPKENLFKYECKAVKEFLSNPSIVILPVGKGRSTAILNCEDYRIVPKSKCGPNVSMITMITTKPLKLCAYHKVRHYFFYSSK